MDWAAVSRGAPTLVLYMARKFAAVMAVGLTPILCVGESLAEREAGRTFEVVDRHHAAFEVVAVGLRHDERRRD